ncbi:MAG: 16S rRNA (uracil(1498)-N(3))-methyltransferase [Rhizobacter sp.]|nr:16S rRNA (uracil(1498)-N(3))-methyltransferase [Rhizobacter sp.]
MPPRLYVEPPLRGGESITLPAGPARHVQVLRLQPGAPLTLFDGQGGEWDAAVLQMGRSEVRVRVVEHRPVERELPLRFTLALGMPANERMDHLIEKATELGVARIQPLVCQRSVLRLAGERAQRKLAHWQAVAVAACEQSGRTRVPVIAPVCSLTSWLADLPQHDAARRILLSLAGAPAMFDGVAGALNSADLVCLSGPEGGLTEAEEAAAVAHGFVATSLGARVLRADTAPLALLAACGLVAAACLSNQGPR